MMRKVDCFMFGHGPFFVGTCCTCGNQIFSKEVSEQVEASELIKSDAQKWVDRLHNQIIENAKYLNTPRPPIL